jgi:hypothetical protein
LLFVQTRRQQNKPLKALRPYALCAGEFTVPQNFDEPLPEEILKDFE